MKRSELSKETFLMELSRIKNISDEAKRIQEYLNLTNAFVNSQPVEKKITVFMN